MEVDVNSTEYDESATTFDSMYFTTVGDTYIRPNSTFDSENSTSSENTFEENETSLSFEEAATSSDDDLFTLETSTYIFNTTYNPNITNETDYDIFEIDSDLNITSVPIDTAEFTVLSTTSEINDTSNDTLTTEETNELFLLRVIILLT